MGIIFWEPDEEGKPMQRELNLYEQWNVLEHQLVYEKEKRESVEEKIRIFVGKLLDENVKLKDALTYHRNSNVRTSEGISGEETKNE